MDAICLNDVKSIISKDSGAHVSIFMPTHSRGGVDQQDPIRLRNLIRVAEEKLVANGMRAAEARVMLRPASELLTDNLFWRQQSDGLALFLDSDTFFHYRVPLGLKEEVGVGERYYIKPLVPMLNICGWYYVLAISQDDVRLLQCTATGSLRIDLGDMPRNIEEALRLESPDRYVQYHAARQVGGVNMGRVSGVQTGTPTRASIMKENLPRFFDIINKHVMQILKNENAPLVLAGVDYLHGVYQKANTYRNLLTEGIMGSPEGLTDTVLREQSWPVVKPYFDQAKKEAEAEYRKSAGTGLTAAGLEDVIPAAYHGRVRFLFLRENATAWGRFDPDSDAVSVNSQPEAADDDLIDLAVFQTLSHAGTIYVLEREDMPDVEPVSAILRF
jgi:hypothetical protein